MRKLLFSLLLAAASIAAAAQTGFAYYDIEQLYDTIPSPFYNDSAYTPEGRYAWNTERYRHKTAGIAAVIDSLGLPLVALCGVENEQVVRDLSAACKGDYVYLHRTLNSLDGLDFALLYHGDRFRPLRCEPGRRSLCIEGVLQRDTVAVLLIADRQTAALQIADRLAEAPQRPLIVAGRLEGIDAARFGLTDRLAAAARKGYGTRRRRGGWQMRDRIFTSPQLGRRAGQVYISRFLLDPHSGEPQPTYSRQRYRGGRSANLPVWCQIE